MIKPLLRAGCALAVVLSPLAAAPTAAAQVQRSAPEAVPVVHSIPDAADTPYPGGPITLDIDASDTSRGAFRVTETIPVAPGTSALVLQLPQWIPGHHSPLGTIEDLADIHFLVDGQPMRWWRDPLEVFAFHLDLPPGTKAVVAKFIHTSALKPSDASVAGRVTMTDEIIDLQWDRMSLYPAGHYVRQIRVRPSVTLPAGWGVASALDGKQRDGARLRWAETDYDTLVDSPVMAGAYFRSQDLGHGVTLDMLADRPGDLAVTQEHLAPYHALVDEALIAFGSHHFDHYDFLLALSDRLGGIGLEHHRSSENSMDAKALIDWPESDWDRGVIPHEFTHSWNGKFRRSARLWTPDYRQPMQDNLLWVYEGQTQFWGLVLGARSGVQSKEAVLGELAAYAGQFSQWPGRGWRSVEDTTFDPIMASRRPKPYASLDRNEDYYTEGALVWLEADQIIRAGTGGKKGLDDFAKGFFGIRDGDWGEVPYEFDDVVAALNAVYPHDWAGFLTTRLRTPGQPAPLAGIEAGGYRLVWHDEPNPYDRARMAAGKTLSLFHSLGVTLDKDGKVLSCRWDSPAFNAALVPGARIIAVNGQVYDPDALKEAITAAKGISLPMELIIQRGDKVLPVSIAYHDGLRWPWLERANPGKAPAGLDLLLSPRRAKH
jgi:predicted metalloprotease with PDZ domain